jgi:glutamate synthase (NADPH/NADH) small chain
LIGAGGVVTGVEFERASSDGSQERFVVEADMVLKAIGQTLVALGIERELLTLDGSRIEVDAQGQTSLPGVWAGGDCAATGGVDLTVQAVQDGKVAAAAIDAQFARTAVKAA